MKYLLALLIPFSCFAQVGLRSPAYVAQLQRPATSSAPTYYGVTNQPLFWVKADAQSLNNNDPVPAPVDSSGRGSEATFGQDNSGNIPVFKSTGLNGLPTMFFDGSDCFTNPSVAVGSYTLLVVTSNSAVGMIVEQSDLTGVSSGFYLYGDVTCSIRVAKLPDVSGQDNVANYSVGKWLILRVDYDGTDAGLLLSTNGVLAGNAACIATADPGTSIITDRITVGARANGLSLPITGHISEFLLFSPALAGASITTVATNIQTKYFP